MEESLINKYIEKVRWQISKDQSHQYTVKQWRKDLNTEFEDFVMHIRNKGYQESFYGRLYIYLEIGEYKYWTMGAPLNETIIINRTTIISQSIFEDEDKNVVTLDKF